MSFVQFIYDYIIPVFYRKSLCAVTKTTLLDHAETPRMWNSCIAKISARSAQDSLFTTYSTQLTDISYLTAHKRKGICEYYAVHTTSGQDTKMIYY